MTKTIVITGASKGIGRYLSEYYVQKGNKVIGISRSGSELIHENYSDFKADISDESAVVSLFRDIKKQYERVDILINNAGMASMNHVLLTPGSTVNKLFSTNFNGTFFCSREAAKIMMKFKGGRIINTSTIAVPMTVEGEAVYAASKSAVETFTKVLAKELAPYNITCNAVGPTPIETDLIRNVPSDKIQKLVDGLVIKRLGQFGDVSNVIDFFIQDSSDYITAQVVYLGGA